MLPGGGGPVAFAQFNDWSARYLAAARGARRDLLAEGQALATARRGVLARLIAAEPRRALENAVPMVVRRQLPAEVVALLEERVSGKGFFGVLGVYGGLGYVGGKGTWLKSITVGVACHELGHNFGVWRANYWNTSYAWDFGDKTFSTTNSPAVSKSWSAAGDYTARRLRRKNGERTDFPPLCWRQLRAPCRAITLLRGIG